MKIMARMLFCLATVFLFSQSLYSLEIKDDAVFIRVIDVGAGLATVVYMPGGY
ncbi:MAG: hypothetical protein GWN62_37460, partial [Aliifodinibius sp.]|nr:hypothetical protein [Fodinibius sp.]